MKDVQCYELFGGIALKIHTFSFSFFIFSPFPFHELILQALFLRYSNILHISSHMVMRISLEQQKSFKLLLNIRFCNMAIMTPDIYIYILIYNSKSMYVVQSLYFGSKLPSSGTYK